MLTVQLANNVRTARDVVQSDLEYICDKLEEELAQMSGKKLLITGCAGFLGYYLVQTILHWNRRTTGNQNISLIAYDNFIRGFPSWLSQLGKQANIQVIEHDITKRLPEDIGDVQYIIHAASIASPTYYRKYPIETMDANVIGLRNVLDYCLKLKETNKTLEAFLFFSSSEIYGDPSLENIPTGETYNGNVSCTGPRACYDESKRYGETLCVNFAKKYNLPIKIARPFNNYGPGLNISDKRVLADFASNLLFNQDIEVFSNGSPTRTFCYVADAIAGYYKILIKGRSGQAYNIGVEEPEISIAELAERVAGIARDLLKWRGKVVYRDIGADHDYLTDNPSRRCPDIAKARSELGYSPTVSLDEGLKRSLIWNRDNYINETPL